MPRDFCDVTIILDRSGSMRACAEGTVEGVNNFIDEQRKVPGDGCWTLIQFDDPASARGAGEAFPQVVLEAVPQGAAPRLTHETFRPRGNTNLIDAVCLAIDQAGRRLAAVPEADRPDKVVMVIMTDGEHNTNGTFTREQMNEKIAHQQSQYNWKFVFLGANQDAFAEAGKYGIARSAAANYAHSNVGSAGALGLACRATRDWKLDGNLTAGIMLSPSDPDDPNATVTTPGSP
jgi:hypothetical protein